MSHIATPQFTRPQKQPIHDTVIHEDDDMAEAEDDPLSKLMTNICNQQLDSWECGFYVMCWIKTIIQAVITDDWNEFTRPQKQPIHDTVIHEDDDMAEAEDDPLSKLMTNICNQQLDSWECGFYVMCWIKTIIQAVITDDWNERFKSTSPIPEDRIRQIRQEWTTYLLQRWS
ncbi:hypothetical protein LR48_Vigan08g045700 [Vigna angularis]|uniref:Ubiquitin-like protease family profile domain-containing protein n=1 Tax=Phaseolus angularis TaxID=3914 RepID=A0A0L9V3I6_PHAAN|nr:hypothetical protein LR48_Vigan08g045700 [Vigna angularis]